MIAVVNYEAGNIRSVMNALSRQGVEALLTDDHDDLKAADKVIFPGVGEAFTAMSHLKRKGLDRVIPTLRQPVLGICVGLQLMCARSEERNTTGMGIFPVSVLQFPPEDKVPHIGWNNFSKVGGSILQGISTAEDLYYVHSYYAELGEDTAATCDYIRPFSAVMERENFYGVQFHPEKSGSVGARVLKNFLKL